MKIIHLNYSSSFGGAADAARSIHFSLLRLGIRSKLIVGRIHSKDGESIVPKIKPYFLQNFYQKILSFLERKSVKRIIKKDFFGKISLAKFGFSDFGKDISEADIIHLHWVNNGFISLEAISKINKPIVWTLHDMWPITGLCHYSKDCVRYKEGCGFCQFMKNEKEKDLSYYLFKKKKKILKYKNIVFVATSTWMYNQAVSSSITKGHKVVEIPLSIDKHIFNVNKFFDKKEFFKNKGIKLTNEVNILLYGAINATTDDRKGFSILKNALLRIPKVDRKKYILLVFGDNLNLDCIDELPVISLGLINDKKKIAKLYNYSDLFLMPSVQEAFGLTTLEAINCGLPVIAFKGTGAEGIIEHKNNGYLAKNGDSESFFLGINFFIKKNKPIKTSIVPNNKFNQEVITEAYINVYKELLN